VIALVAVNTSLSWTLQRGLSFFEIVGVHLSISYLLLTLLALLYVWNLGLLLVVGRPPRRSSSTREFFRFQVASVCFVVVMLLSATWAISRNREDSFLAIRQGGSFCAYLLPLPLSMWLTRRVRAIRLFAVFLAAGIVPGLLMLAHMTLGAPLPGYEGQEVLITADYFYKLTVLDSFMVAVLVLAGASAWLGLNRGGVRAVGLACLGSSLYLLFTSPPKSSLVGIAVGGAVLCAELLRQRRSRGVRMAMVGVLSVLAIIGVGHLFADPEEYYGGLRGIVKETVDIRRSVSAASRWQGVQAAVEEWTNSSILLGSGLGSENIRAMTVYGMDNPWQTPVVWTNFLAKSGVVGLAALLVLLATYAALLWATWRVAAREEDRAIVLAIAAGFAAILVVMSTGGPEVYSLSMAVYLGWTSAALSAILREGTHDGAAMSISASVTVRRGCGIEAEEGHLQRLRGPHPPEGRDSEGLSGCPSASQGS
jgi:hypothetical protein